MPDELAEQVAWISAWAYSIGQQRPDTPIGNIDTAIFPSASMLGI